MATVNTQLRNVLATMATTILDSLDIRTAGGAALLAELTTLDWSIAASGAVSLSSTESDPNANNTGTAAEGRFQHTNGGASGYQVNDSGDALSVGDVAIEVDTGSGTFSVGDIIRFNGDNQDYVVIKELAAPGTLYIFPGLKADPGDGAAITTQTAAEISGLTVGESGSEINLNSVNIDTDEQVDVTAFTFTAPAS